MRGHRVWSEIDLSAIRSNLAVVGRHVRPGTHVMAVVKADAYGHGAVPVAWTALESGAGALGVGDSSEALELRESGITAPILILGAIIEEEIPKVIENNVAVTVHSADLLPILDEEARRQRRCLRVHLKIDTGMGRLGVSPGNAAAVAHAVLESRNLELEGVSTHLSSVASGSREYTAEQLNRFNALLNELARDGVRPPMIHVANSVGLFSFPDAHFDMVRTGIAMYGLDPGLFAALKLPLRPAISLKTRIAFLKGAPEGSCIGYDQRFETRRATKIATCPVGYNDGYPYLLTNKGEALVRGCRVPVVGTVTMDYIMLDVGNLPDVALGDEVTLIGRDGAEEIRPEHLARKIGTSPLEITCGLGRRVKRVYVRETTGIETADEAAPRKVVA